MSLTQASGRGGGPHRLTLPVGGALRWGRRTAREAEPGSGPGGRSPLCPPVPVLSCLLCTFSAGLRKFLVTSEVISQRSARTSFLPQLSDSVENLMGRSV